MAVSTKRPPGVLRSWLHDRLAVHRTILWFAVWVLVAIGLNGAGGYLAVHAWSAPPEVLYLEFASDETTAAPSRESTVNIPLAATDGEAATPITVFFSVDGIEQPPQTFAKASKGPFDLRVPLPQALQSRRVVNVTIKSVRGAVLGARTSTRLVIPPTEFVTFRETEIVVPYGKSFPGAEVYASGPLPNPVGYAIERMDNKPPAGERPIAAKGDQNWQIPADAIDAPEWGQTYSLYLKPPLGIRIGDIGKLLVRYETTPKLYVLDLKATPITVPATGDKVTLTARLSSKPNQEVELPITLTLSGMGADWIEGPLERTIKIKPTDPDPASGSVDIVIRKREYPAEASDLLVTLKVPELYRASANEADATRTATVRLTAPPAPNPLVLTVDKMGDAKIEQVRKDARVSFVCTLSREAPADLKVRIAFDDGDTAKPGKHFQITGLTPEGQLLFEKGAKSKTIVLEPIPKLNLQPDRALKLMFKKPVDTDLKIEGDTFPITLTDKLAERKLLVLVLALGPTEEDKKGFAEGWTKNHLDAWKKEKNDKGGEGTWCRAVLVGAMAEGGKLTPNPTLLGSANEMELPLLSDAGGAKRPPQLAELINLAMATRRELLSELPVQEQKEIQTAIIWRSTKTPTALQKSIGKLLAQETQNDLKDLKGRFAFVWYGGNDFGQDDKVDTVLREVLLELLHGRKSLGTSLGALTGGVGNSLAVFKGLWDTPTARPAIRLVLPSDIPSPIPEGVIEAFEAFK